MLYLLEIKTHICNYSKYDLHFKIYFDKNRTWLSEQSEYKTIGTLWSLCFKIFHFYDWHFCEKTHQNGYQTYAIYN